MFKAFYDKKRFRFIHQELISSGLIQQYTNQSLIKKTACFYGENFNIYIDTSDGVNEDLKIQEYCGRIKRVIIDSKEKPFLFFKSAYSNKWSKNIEKLAKDNNGKVIPFFKWSFNEEFYKHVLGRKKEILSKFKNQEKIYDIGIFFSEKIYQYPKPSESDPLISWEDHLKFNLPGKSKNTGVYKNNSRKNLIKKIKDSNFKLLHAGMPYLDYVKASFQCKVIINPPGIGEYTSRMVDQTYLGNCIALRKNSYDNGHTWKNHIPEINFQSNDWKNNIKHIVDDYLIYQKKSQEYYENFWTPQTIVKYLKRYISEFSEIK